MILEGQFGKATADGRGKIVRFYLDHLDCVNNWDLVDFSAPKLLGEYLYLGDTSILFLLSRSRNVWKKRIAVLAFFTFIKNNSYDEFLKLAESLLCDSHDLIHKAVGWMLRETGKRNSVVLEAFLQKHARSMPRTMLRYAIERLDETKRRSYLNLKG